MKILHIFDNSNEKFSEPYIDFICKNFDSREHLFFHIGADIRTKKTMRNNMRFIVKLKYLQLIREMNSAGKIILHGLFLPRMFLILFLQPWLLKKCYWVVWGADLYQYRIAKESGKANVNEFIRKLVIRNIGNIATLVKGDYDLAREWYGARGKYFKARYINEESNVYLNDLVKIPPVTHEEVRILLGNSASETNNHFEALDILAAFSAENIRVICPLSYGDNDYRDRVIDYGQRVLGDKFSYLDRFYNVKEYMDILYTVDIGIFNNDRQQALGNIFPLLYLGKKVYMKSDTTMWDEIRNVFGLETFEIGRLSNESFEQFKHISKETSLHNKRIMEGLYNGDYAEEAWSRIFNN